MNEHIQEVYNLGLEKFAGDADAAKEFTVAFIKEAGLMSEVGAHLGAGAVKAIGTGLGGLALGLGIHGMSSAMSNVATANLRSKFQASLAKVTAENPIISHADAHKVQSYAETVFKFAPHVAVDPNLLSSILANAVHGEGIDPMTIKTLTELESRVVDTRKNALFSPKAYG